MKTKDIKIFALFATFSLVALIAMSFTFKIPTPMEKVSLYDIEINSLEGEPLDLHQFQGKKILFVNVASKCGYTPQYKDLQVLSDKYKEQLTIIGVPCNQFGKQEPGSPEEIATFCERNYGVTFPMTEKVDVKGDNQHPLYQWLTSKNMNGVEESDVKWNFQKYMVDENGNLLEVFPSGVKPMDDRIISLLDN